MKTKFIKILDDGFSTAVNAIKKIVFNKTFRKALSAGIEAIITGLRDYLIIKYVKKIIDLKKLDCLFSLGAFTAGYLDYYSDKSLNDYIVI